MPIYKGDNTTYPQYLKRRDKRNVVRTPQGWVRISKHGGSPNELLEFQANNAVFAAPAIIDVWHSMGDGRTANTAKLNTVVSTIISYNQPIQNLGGSLKISVANTAGGGALTGIAPAQTVFEGNKLKFTWTPTVAGTYKVQAQTASNASATAVSVRSTTPVGNNAVSLVITGAASNTAASIIAS